ncbi:MAG TPA: hypothetical protein VNQ57_01530, partial [Ureibacillus sp.]|nr:hypothetical protein [Ureibacillus sp.]
PLMLKVDVEKLKVKCLEFYEDEMVAGAILYNSDFTLYRNMKNFDILFSIMYKIIEGQTTIREHFKKYNKQDLYNIAIKYYSIDEKLKIKDFENLIEELYNQFLNISDKIS